MKKKGDNSKLWLSPKPGIWIMESGVEMLVHPTRLCYDFINFYVIVENHDRCQSLLPRRSSFIHESTVTGGANGR